MKKKKEMDDMNKHRQSIKHRWSEQGNQNTDESQYEINLGR